jgi:O-antigen ligase
MIPLTGSRSGLLNLLFFVGIVMLEGRFNYRKVVGLALVTFFMAIQFGYDISVLDLILPEEIASRLTHVGLRGEILEEEGLEAAGSTEGRVRTMQAALRVWSLHPVFGVGIGNFNTERAVTDPFGTVGPPHDSYLWALSEGGLFALILYLGFFWWVFKKIRGIEWEYQARFGPVDLGWMVSAMRTVIIGFLFFSFFADMWHHELFYIIAGMSLALIRLHELYAETGQAPQPFVIGRQLQPVRLPPAPAAA